MRSLLSQRIDDGAGCSRQRLVSGLRPVDLQDIRGDVDESLVGHALKLKERVAGGDLEALDERGGGLISPSLEEDFAGQRRHKTAGSNEFLIRRAQGADRWKLVFVALPAQQCRSVALPARALVHRAAGLCLSGSEDWRRSGLLAGHDEK